MTDREKVIKGLECHVKGDCAECPYREGWHACNLTPESGLFADTLALLKAQQPRVMTLGEMPECVQIPCWLEWRDGDSYYAIIHADGVKVDYARLFFICAFFKSEYGITVRCWNIKPTDEQREAVKWE